MNNRYEVRCADDRVVGSFEDSEGVADGFGDYYAALEKARARTRAADLSYAVWDTEQSRFVYPWKGDEVAGQPGGTATLGGCDE